MSVVKTVAAIEYPRGYEAGVVNHLQHLLQAGAPAQRDPQRENFYEIDGEEGSYYIHISPITGNVILLAKWTRQAEGCCLNPDCAMA